MSEIKWTFRLNFKGEEVRWNFHGKTRIATYLYKGVMYEVKCNPFTVESDIRIDIKTKEL